MTIEEIEKSDLKAGTFGVFTSTEKVKKISNESDVWIEYLVKEYGFYGGIVKQGDRKSIIRYNATNYPEYFPKNKYEWIDFTPLTEIPICEEQK